MSDESLSQNQVESLLRAMSHVDGDDTTGTQPGVGQRTANEARSNETGADPARASGSAAEVTTYDFQHPQRLGKRQIAALIEMHRPVAAKFSAAVSRLLRTMVEVRLRDIELHTYGEFVFGLAAPSSFHLLASPDLCGNWMIDVSPALASSIIERMLGGDPDSPESDSEPVNSSGSASSASERPTFTEIEGRLIGHVVQTLLVPLHDAWRKFIPTELHIDSIPRHPQSERILPADTPVIVVAFTVGLGRRSGTVRLCIPVESIDSFRSELSTDGYLQATKPGSTEHSRRTVSRSVSDAPVDIIVTLARSKIRTQDLLELSIGDIITTEKDASEPLEFAVQNVPKFRARPGSYQGKKAVRLEPPSAGSPADRPAGPEA